MYTNATCPSKKHAILQMVLEHLHNKSMKASMWQNKMHMCKHARERQRARETHRLKIYMDSQRKKDIIFQKNSRVRELVGNM